MPYKNSFVTAGLIYVIIVTLTACGGSGTEGAAQTEQGRFELGRLAYNSQNYAGAIDVFSQQLAAFPSGDLADDAILYEGRSYYWLADYSNAALKFNQILTDFPGGDKIDAANYWLAKTYHAEAVATNTAAQFKKARDAYAAISSVTYSDNAAYQIGRSYFDEALLAADTDTGFAVTSLETAISLLSTMITDFAATSSLSIDDAQFYIGRSYHELALLVVKDASLHTTPHSVLFNQARTAYVTPPLDSVLSSFMDDAEYFHARTFHDEKMYSQARLNYQTIVAGATSAWADDAKYQIGQSHYDEALAETDPKLALSSFYLAIAEFSDFDSAYIGSSRRDDAAYFKARAQHRQAIIVAADPGLEGATIDLTAELGVTETVLSATTYFVNARAAFQFLITNFATSGWVDNAQYQIGATYYDESEISETTADYDLMQQQLNNAIRHFSTVTNDPVLQLLNSADNAQYFLGRSYQRIADLDLVKLTTDPTATKRNIIDLSGTSITVNHQTARDAYTKLLTDNLFANSNWKDNAQYRIGKSYYTEANIELAQPTPNPVNVVNAYNAALGKFNDLIVTYPDSSRIDNAAFEIGSIYHDTCHRNQEFIWFDFVSNYGNNPTLIKDNANNLHLFELQPEAGSHLGCPAIPTYAVDTLYTPPPII